MVTPFAVVDVEKVRHERQVELAFEGHRFWDMKRWRIAHLPVDQVVLTVSVGQGYIPSLICVFESTCLKLLMICLNGSVSLQRKTIILNSQEMI